MLVSLTVLAGSLSVSAQQPPTKDDIEARDTLIVAQENLLNAYRCRFGTDTHIVPGGCLGGEPALGPLMAKPFNGTPMRELLVERDKLIASQEDLLNAYRCLFQVDIQIVAGGCSGVVANATPTAEPDPADTWTWPEFREWRSGTAPSGRVFAETATVWGGGNSDKIADYLWLSCVPNGSGGLEVGVTDSNGWYRWDDSFEVDMRTLLLAEGTAWWEWDWDQLVGQFDDLLPLPWGDQWRGERSVDFYPFDGSGDSAFLRWANYLSRGGWLMMLADGPEGEVVWLFHLEGAYQHIMWVAERCRFTSENGVIQHRIPPPRVYN